MTVIYNGIALDNVEIKNSRLKIRAEFGLKENQPVITEVEGWATIRVSIFLSVPRLMSIEKFPEAVCRSSAKRPGKMEENTEGAGGDVHRQRKKKIMSTDTARILWT